MLQVSPRGDAALTVDASGTAALIDPATHETLHLLDGFQLGNLNQFWRDSLFLFSDDGQQVLGAVENSHLLVYDVASGELLREIHNPDGHYRWASYVPGRNQVFASGERGAYLLDPDTGEQTQVFEIEDFLYDWNWTGLLTVSSDGKYGALSGRVSSEEGEVNHMIVRVWDLDTGDIVYEDFQGDTNAHITTLVFSDDKRYFVWGGFEHIAHVVDLELGEEVATFEHADNILGADFSADNRLLTVTSKDGTTQIWNLKTGEALRRFWSGSDQALMYVNFVEDDTHIVFAEATGDGIIHRAPVTWEALKEDVCSRVLRDLTPEERERYNLDDSPTCPKFAEP